MDASSAESGVTTESISRVKTQIAEKIEMFPNVQAQHQPDGEIDISPKQTIVNHDIGSWTNTKEPPKDEKQEGRTVITAVANMIRDSLTQNYFNLNNNSPTDFIVADSVIAKDLDQNPELAKMLKLDQQESKYRILMGKGYPPAIARAIVIAAVQQMAKSVDAVVSEEATVIDNKYVVERKATLETDLRKLEEQKQENARLLAQKQEAQQKAKSDSEAASERLATLDNNKQTILETYAAYLKSRPTTDLSKLPSALQIMERKGGMLGLGAKAELRKDAFLPLDQIITNLVAISKEKNSSFQAFGVESAGGLVVKAATKYLEEYGNDMTFDKLTIEARSIISKLSSSNIDQAQEMSRIMTFQESFLRELSIKNPPEAKKTALELTARVMAIYVLNNGNQEVDLQRLKVEHPLTDNFLRYFPAKIANVLEATTSYQRAKTDREEAAAVLRQADQELSETQRTKSSLENRVQDAQTEKTELVRDMERRINQLKNTILSEVLITQHGIKPKFERPWKSYYIQSKLLIDTVKAIFEGMPKCISADASHRQSVDEGLRMSLGGNRYEARKEYFSNYPDFLPDLVSAIIPTDHPTPELAVEFICDFLRRYPAEPRDGNYWSQPLAFSGYTPAWENPEDRNKRVHNEEYARTTLLPVVKEIIKGGRIIKVPEEIKRLDLPLLAEKHWEGPEAQQELKTTSLAFIDWLKELSIKNCYIVSQYLLRNPEENRKPGLSRNQFDNGDINSPNDNPLAALCFFKGRLSTYNPSGDTYIVEAKD